MSKYTVETTEKGSKSTFETTDVIEAVRKLDTYTGSSAKTVCLSKDGKEVLSYDLKPEPMMSIGAPPGARGGPKARGK
jgi:hypothetical protein